jgi:hypothetical protein
MIIKHHARWPDADYDDVRNIVQGLKMEEAAAVDLLNGKDGDLVRKVAQRYAREDLHCYQNGWRLKTSIRGETLFLVRLPK